MAIDKTQRRLELLAAARNVFARKGYHDAKVDDIVAEASVSKGTFYLYFPDKRSIFEALADELAQQLQQAILRVDLAGNVAEQVRQNIRSVLGAFLADPTLTTIFFSYAAGLDPDFVQKVRAVEHTLLAILEEALRDGQNLGIVGQGDPGILAVFTLGGMKSLLLDACQKAPLSQEERERIVEEVFRILDHGYLRIDRQPAP
ncbi:MAG: TetR/AcrR family transcriptional regulator [Polyangiaceae bacterium]|jgi:AcrR family transcriptional regulator|nr:TetR/AcrR family transcriptional regulator [Polyangiaceae bacterium]